MIGSAITNAIPLLQANAESMMVDTITVKRVPVTGVPDPVTLQLTKTPTVVYSGKGRVKPMKRITAGGVNVGEIKDSSEVYIISVPHSATGIRPGDIVSITASTDADLLVDTFRVVIVEDSAQTTARRLTCELVEARQ